MTVHLDRMAEEVTGTIDPETLKDDAGQLYEISADAWQLHEDDPITTEIRVERADQMPMSEAERLDALGAETPAQEQAFLDRVARNDEKRGWMPKTDDAVRDWLDADGPEERELEVQLRGGHVLDPPRVGQELFGAAPELALELLEERLIHIETHKTIMEERQSDFVAAAEAAGATVLDQHWVVNALRVMATPAQAAVMRAHPSLRRMTFVGAAVEDLCGTADTGFHGLERRELTQTQQFVGNGVDGGEASGRATNPAGHSVSAMYVGLIDKNLDLHHPAFHDASGNDRIIDAWKWDTGVGDFVEDTGTGVVMDCCDCPPNCGALRMHGSKVAGIILADLTEGQDTGVSEDCLRAARTGMAPSSELSFISNRSHSHAAMEYAYEFGFDVVNLSFGWARKFVDERRMCYPEWFLEHGLTNALAKDGVLVVKSAGNENKDVQGLCNVSSPAPAAGSFNVGAVLTAAPDIYNDPEKTLASSRGGDKRDHAVVDIMAPGGSKGDTLPVIDTGLTQHVYKGVGSATSFATATVSGAAVDFKHHLLNAFGSSTANTSGYIRTGLRIFGDGTNEDTAVPSRRKLDRFWGAGMLKMRGFNDQGMDAPWRVRFKSFVLADGNTKEVAANWNGSSNPVLPSDADQIRASVGWYEPNLAFVDTAVDTGVDEDPAEISFELVRDTTPQSAWGYDGPDSEPSKVLRIASGAGGYSWFVRLQGLNIPVGTDTGHASHNVQERRVFVTLFWEDTDRDDADGPDTGIE